MHASSFCFKMRFKIEMSQMHLGPSQNGNSDQNYQIANPNGPIHNLVNSSHNNK